MAGSGVDSILVAIVGGLVALTIGSMRTGVSFADWLLAQATSKNNASRYRERFMEHLTKGW